MQVNACTVTAHDIGDNVVDVPNGKLRVSITGTSAPAQAHTDQQHLTVSRQEAFLKVAPFQVVTTTPGILSFGLLLATMATSHFIL